MNHSLLLQPLHHSWIHEIELYVLVSSKLKRLKGIDTPQASGFSRPSTPASVACFLLATHACSGDIAGADDTGQSLSTKIRHLRQSDGMTDARVDPMDPDVHPTPWPMTLVAARPRYFPR